MHIKKMLVGALAILVTSGMTAHVAKAQGGGGGAPAQAGGPGQGGGQAGGQRPAPPPMRIVSADIADGKQLPGKFTCASGTEAVSPGLQWMQPPRGTETFALIVHDMEPRPRKGVDDILHWMVWNMPASANSLPQGVSSASADLPDGSHQTNGGPRTGREFRLPAPMPAAGRCGSAPLRVRNLRARPKA